MTTNTESSTDAARGTESELMEMTSQDTSVATVPPNETFNAPHYTVLYACPGFEVS